MSNVTPDQIDPSDIIWENGQPGILNWPIMSILTHLELGHGVINIEHTKIGEWPSIAISEDGTKQEATICVGFFIRGKWVMTGAERLRPNQNQKELGKPSDMTSGWLYATDRWPIMSQYTPKAGELIAFMIACGDQREKRIQGVKERTNIIIVSMPSDQEVAHYEASANEPLPHVEPPTLPGAQPPTEGEVNNLTRATEVILQRISDVDQQWRQIIQTDIDHNTGVINAINEIKLSLLVMQASLQEIRDRMDDPFVTTGGPIKIVLHPQRPEPKG